MVSLGRVKTCSYLLNLNIISREQAFCSFCNSEIETVQHLFFSCPFTWQIWTDSFKWWGTSSVIHEDPSIMMESWNNIVSPRRKFKKKFWNSLFFVIIWTIWYERNLAKFQGKHLSLSDIQYDVKLRLGFWIKCYAPSFPYLVLQVVCSSPSVWDWKIKTRRLQ